MRNEERRCEMGSEKENHSGLKSVVRLEEDVKPSNQWSSRI